MTYTLMKFPIVRATKRRSKKSALSHVTPDGRSTIDANEFLNRAEIQKTIRELGERVDTAIASSEPKKN